MIQEQKNLLELIKKYVFNLSKNDKTGHGNQHLKRVAGLAKIILKDYPQADDFLVLAAVYLHDSYDDKLYQDPAAAKQKTDDFLKKIGLDGLSKQIFFIIDNMSWSKQRFGQAKKLDINGQIVQDADRLDAIGAIAVIRAFKYGSAHDQADYDPKIKVRDLKNKQEYRNENKQTTINHFYEKLFTIKDLMNTDSAKKIAARRDEFMHSFVKEYIDEYNLKA
ncbi:HD domain-containing protein [Oenococcus alcoholitolerans]|uniref:HD domain-containing protein n=1 Tax=Oenococcus alcoholitolerans TaxID=931074 RepID=UPI003F71EDD4